VSLLASILNAAQNVGYPALVLLVMAESGGLPVPGETALITAAILASTGRLSIVAVIALAAFAAIVGDNIGYVIGRRGGRWLLQRPGPFVQHRRQVLEIGEPFFDRHGPKAVFFGRWILGLRTWASWLAGATRMRWGTFAVWNALGGISWAATIGLLAYLLGHSVEKVITSFGLYGLGAVVVAGLGVLLLHRLHRRFIRRVPAPAADRPDAGDDTPARSRSARAPDG
jgi:membrane protein DedA with SNARE-associated domain